MRILVVFLVTMLSTVQSGDHIPRVLTGNWSVGMPYDLGQPVGLDANQEKKIKGLNVHISGGYIEVCGKSIPVKSVSVETLSAKQFLERFNFSPVQVGLRGLRVTEVIINKYHSTNTCGDFEDPGSHLFVSAGAVVMETGNDYFPLKRR
ncbi:hypothetical protein [Solilutibacter silvestris]|uniref:hypothetical protein n=1 Tax=Solilutibacter silvestris TaxID=1645665 RepID=UPI003D33B568